MRELLLIVIAIYYDCVGGNRSKNLGCCLASLDYPTTAIYAQEATTKIKV